MIGYLEGKLIKIEEDRILLLVNHVGYEVLLPAIVMETVKNKAIGDELTLYIYHQQTERQPKPVLIGFNLEVEREFFQRFITVEDIGPLKAVKALNTPVREIARAIESRDSAALQQLKGIGKRTCQKIIATLEGRMGKFALIRESEEAAPPAMADLSGQVLNVLVSQLGHREPEARRMIDAALQRNPSISSPEELFEEVYRSENTDG
jgi:Holliday junction DNA helicase RuvA